MGRLMKLFRIILLLLTLIITGCASFNPPKELVDNNKIQIGFTAAAFYAGNGIFMNGSRISFTYGIRNVANIGFSFYSFPNPDISQKPSWMVELFGMAKVVNQNKALPKMNIYLNLPVLIEPGSSIPVSFLPTLGFMPLYKYKRINTYSSFEVCMLINKKDKMPIFNMKLSTEIVTKGNTEIDFAVNQLDVFRLNKTVIGTIMSINPNKFRITPGNN